MFVFFRMFSARRLLDVVLRKGSYTTLMISTMGKHITYTINLVARRGNMVIAYRLGHLSFKYLRHLFPNLFLQSKDIEFNCKTCILAKSYRTFYYTSLNKSSIPFALIHSNAWGSSPQTIATSLVCYICQ